VGRFDLHALDGEQGPRRLDVRLVQGVEQRDGGLRLGDGDPADAGVAAEGPGGGEGEAAHRVQAGDGGADVRPGEAAQGLEGLHLLEGEAFLLEPVGHLARLVEGDPGQGADLAEDALGVIVHAADDRLALDQLVGAQTGDGLEDLEGLAGAGVVGGRGQGRGRRLGGGEQDGEQQGQRGAAKGRARS
jgi:hypothetical protein